MSALRRTPLFDKQKQLGAEFSRYSGWELPERFAAIEVEYDAVRSRAGVLDLSFRNLVRVGGNDRFDFLHRLVSAEVKSLEEGGVIPALLLNRKGKIQTTMTIIAERESLLLFLPPNQAEGLVATLTDLVFTEDVAVEDVSWSFGTLLVAGRGAANPLEPLFGSDVSRLPNSQIARISLAGKEILLLKSVETGEDGLLFLVPIDAIGPLYDRLLEGNDSSIAPIGMSAYHALRIEAGTPLFSVDIDANTLPQEAGLEAAISFEKGCYIGQEVVERLRARGHINRILVGIVIEEETLPNAQDRLFMKGEEVGSLTSVTFSPALGHPVALGYVKRKRADEGTLLTVRTDHGELPGRVTPLPFYQPPSREDRSASRSV